MSHSEYDPDQFRLTKAEVLDYMKVVVVRLKNNPRVPWKVRKKLEADVKLFEWFESESEMRYHWSLFMELVDGIRAINERKNDPALQRINELNRQAFIHKLAIPPEVVTQLDASKILAQAKAAMMYGGMKDG